ncbi:DUF4178 domain-containing protein [Gordonia zhaorongruii]|uniref:DUF4178 domain-containing protein n=1 Tax=Gordonia zhaorongruii TaxID=2597659 RepID=UPI00118123A9|nr:DUF4178 domain-containing protein [Gordonia zhaorongruii]
MEFVVIILIALLAVVAAVVIMKYLEARKRRKAEADALRDRAYRPGDPFSTADDDAVRGNPRDLTPGDLVEIRGETYAVRGTLRLTQGSYVWTENFLDTGLGHKAWISVEDDPDLEVVLWQEVNGATVSPGPSTVELQGVRYTSDESGAASFTSAGTTGLAANGRVSYHDYSAGDARLSFEDFGPGWECARGDVLRRSEYRIFPSSTTT